MPEYSPQTWIITVETHHYCLTKVEFIRFLSFPFYIVLFGRKCLCTDHTKDAVSCFSYLFRRTENLWIGGYLLYTLCFGPSLLCLLLKLFQLWPFGAFWLVPVPLWHDSIHMRFLYLLCILYLLAYKIVQVILYISYPGLAISSSSPTSFYWRRVLEIKICTLGTLVAIGMLLVLGPLLLRQEGNTSVHANPCLYTHL